MTLLAVAPGFHLDGSWAGRLRLGAGRTPDAAELAALAAEMPGDSPGLLCLFRLPAHLLESFWAALEREGGLGPDAACGFFAEVAAFLEYKRFAPPTGAVFEVVVRKQGEAAAVRHSSDWGAVNLGDEATHVVFVACGAPVRLRLEPGEGYRLPAGGLEIGACTVGMEGPGVALEIRLPGG